ncbi:MAG: (2Fe-2S)-binding protein [Sinimarinibacterium sp.]|jgi:bacterioferritin-associated ferredoxin
MYVCVCKAVSDRDIRRAVRQDGVVSLRELSSRTGLGTCCGKCVAEARALLRAEVAAHGEADPHYASGAAFGTRAAA